MALSGNSILIDTDAYKNSHYLQVPNDMEYTSFYMEARKNPWGPLITFFGYEHILEDLTQQITKPGIEEAYEYWHALDIAFPRQLMDRLVDKHHGFLPLRIQAVLPGTRLPHKNVLMQVMNTDPEFYWLPGWVETKLLRVWYPATVCTLSGTIRDDIRRMLELTSDTPEEELPYKLHDFGSRGSTSVESAQIGGAAHLVNFKGTDTGVALHHIMRFYDIDSKANKAASVPAAEHSTITAWGREFEKEAYENMLDKFGNTHPLLAVVSDSYNIYNAVDNIWGRELKDKVVEMGATLVVRPDSGDPVSVPVEVVEKLDKAFGHTINHKGYKVLNHVRVIQGDGVNRDSINSIMNKLVAKGYSISNIAFGMGGALLQKLDRDTLGFAMKQSAVCRSGVWYDTYKDPITDVGKSSKKGTAGVTNSIYRR